MRCFVTFGESKLMEFALSCTQAKFYSTITQGQQGRTTQRSDGLQAAAILFRSVVRRQPKIEAFIAIDLHALDFGPPLAHRMKDCLSRIPLDQVVALLTNNIARAGAGFGVGFLRQLPVEEDVFLKLLIPHDAWVAAAASTAKAPRHLVPGESGGRARGSWMSRMLPDSGRCPRWSE